MKKVLYIVLTLVVIGGVFVLYKDYQNFQKLKSEINNNSENQVLEEVQDSQQMKLQTAFGNSEAIPVKYTCDGEGINPPITISGVSEKAKSLVLVIDDPDAKPDTFTHWIVWNIPPDVQQIPEDLGKKNDYIEGVNGYSLYGYGAICPPKGEEHKYFIRVYGVDLNLSSVPKTTSRQSLEFQIQNHIVDSATVMGTYKRK